MCESLCGYLTSRETVFSFKQSYDGKESACNAGHWGLTLGWEDPLEKEMATHSSNIAWKIPWMEEAVRYSPWGYKELDTIEQIHFHFSWGMRIYIWQKKGRL